MKIWFLTKSSSLTASSTISFGRAYESRIFTLHFPSAKEKEGKNLLALKENANLRRLWERLFLIIVRFFNLTPICFNHAREWHSHPPCVANAHHVLSSSIATEIRVKSRRQQPLRLH
ncbi:hypothetical protein I7I53_01966 [Histoplasma capsulatum var. duboisii H88]|uniref:Uncharacterized protein n=1 Tax=Ajellomyces capsulatus (strain H88) TaxID=544711 RepID=A0A8A1LR17_AJEC8|nr:hypothetical protein I7I53_01966 [Histoplasma capsulatum var. duboisii H88]